MEGPEIKANAIKKGGKGHRKERGEMHRPRVIFFFFNFAKALKAIASACRRPRKSEQKEELKKCSYAERGSISFRSASAINLGIILLL